MKHNLLPRMIALAVVVVLGVYYIAFDVMQYHVTVATVLGDRPHAERRRVVLGGRRDLQGGAGRNGDRPPPRSAGRGGHAWDRCRSAHPGQRSGPGQGAVRPGRAVPRPPAGQRVRARPGPGNRHPAHQGDPAHAHRDVPDRPQHDAPEHQPERPADRRELLRQRIRRYRSRSPVDHRDRSTALRRTRRRPAGDGEPGRRRSDRPADAAGDGWRPGHVRAGPRFGDRAAAHVQYRCPGTDPEQPGGRAAAQPASWPPTVRRSPHWCRTWPPTPR